MANKSYWWPTAFTGGTAGVALDSIDGAGLVDGDYAIVTIGSTHYFYRLSGSSGAAEASPGIIAPDANAGDKRWLLQNGNGKWKVGSFTFTGVHGPQSVTGVGFRPSLVFFLMHATTGYWSVGADDAASRCCVGMGNVGNGSMNYSNMSIIYYKDAGTNLHANLTSLDSDGFTLYQYVEGSVTSIVVHYLAIS